MTSSQDYRQWFADVLDDVRGGRITAEAAIEAVNQGPHLPQGDKALGNAYHFLYHYYADEDIRARDANYAAHQEEVLADAIVVLRQPFLPEPARPVGRRYVLYGRRLLNMLDSVRRNVLRRR